MLAARCYGCHSAGKQTSGLALDSKAALERGGSRGSSIHPGDPAGSLLLKAISYSDPALKMPPDGKLPDAVIADFEGASGRPCALLAAAYISFSNALRDELFPRLGGSEPGTGFPPPMRDRPR